MVQPAEVGRLRNWLMQMFVHAGNAGIGRKRWRQRQAFIQQAPHSVNVGTRVDRQPRTLLRAHILDAADCHARARQFLFTVHSCQPGKPKIKQLNVFLVGTILCDCKHDIFRFDIAMKNTFAVRMFECTADRQNNLQRLADAHATLTLAQNLIEALSDDTLHNNIRIGIPNPIGEETNDARMSQSTQNSRLAFEPSAIVFVVRGSAGEHLNSYQPPQFWVFCLIDNSHATRSQHLPNLIFAFECGAFCQQHTGQVGSTSHAYEESFQNQRYEATCYVPGKPSSLETFRQNAPSPAHPHRSEPKKLN